MLDRKLVTAVFKRDGWKCRHCGDRTLHPHHLVYKSHGGLDVMNNLLSLCVQCHDAHHAHKLLIDVLEVLENDVRVKFTRMKNWRPV